MRRCGAHLPLFPTAVAPPVRAHAEAGPHRAPQGGRCGRVGERTLLRRQHLPPHASPSAPACSPDRSFPSLQAQREARRAAQRAQFEASQRRALEAQAGARRDASSAAAAAGKGTPTEAARDAKADFQVREGPSRRGCRAGGTSGAVMKTIYAGLQTLPRPRVWEGGARQWPPGLEIRPRRATRPPEGAISADAGGVGAY